MLVGMGYQFVHLETYSRKADSAGRSTTFVLDEAERRLDACQHVAEPVPPTVVFGMSVSEVRDLHDVRAAAAMTEAAGKARRIRSDQHTLGTVVASFPVPWDEVRSAPSKAEALANWERRTVDWLRDQYGEQLVSVLAHCDERFPHLHAYILPADPSMRAKVLHAGWSAKASAVAAAKAGGADGKTANAKGDVAYKAAMRAWQDSYWQAVGLPCGLARLGPGRRRLTRAAWQTEQAAARTTAVLMGKADEAQRAVQEAEAELGARSQAASNLEGRAKAAAENAYSAIAEAKMRLAEAKQAVDSAVAARRQAEANARREARAVLAQARIEGAHIVAAAEAKAAPMRRFGGWLGSVWAGFRSVERKLVAAADARVAAARTVAAAEIAEAKARLREEARQEVGDLLTELRQTAARAEDERKWAEKRLEKLEANAKRHAEAAQQAKDALGKEKSARQRAEAERERFQSLWADADNVLRAIEQEPCGGTTFGHSQR
ncbi:hypothetical protein [Insolitispirillum peregrinum]|uniref:hypothetical protein n=1 Tax=Insolitispirillum peregrinum TaxID=80876 RepID=UPI00361B41E4